MPNGPFSTGRCGRSFEPVGRVGGMTRRVPVDRQSSVSARARPLLDGQSSGQLPLASSNGDSVVGWNAEPTGRP
jgi:hypothetical protein